MSTNQPETKTVSIKNFKLSVFQKQVDQSLMVDKQLTMQFDTKMVKSCSATQTKTLLKLWTIPLERLIDNAPELLADETTETLTLDEKPAVEPQVFDFPTFDFYVLNGDTFKKTMSVYSADIVDVEFILHKRTETSWQAAGFKITGKTKSGFDLSTTFELSTAESIVEKVEDYEAIIKQCTPDDDMFEFVLTNDMIKTIKGLIKDLHKTLPDNTSYLTFEIDKSIKKIKVSDKVFNTSFDIPIDTLDNFPDSKIVFNIFKSNFIIIGNRTFTINTNEHSPKVIFTALFGEAIISCMCMKLDQSKVDSMTSTVIDSTIADAITSKYFDDEDDLPF